MKQLFILVQFLFIGILVHAQTFTGKVTDEANQPLPYANVVLLALPDSAFVTGTVSDAEGRFALQATKENLLLRVSSIGYATLYNKVKNADLGILQLQPETQLLGEVVVKGDLPVTRVKGDALVTSVQNSTLAKAGTAKDVLGKLPGMTDSGKGLEVLGRGTPEYYINGRKVRDEAELDQLASEQIKDVEVVTNPGARYGASVKAVVRIQTKRQQGEGFGFNNRTKVNYNEEFGWLDQFNFNYRKNSFDLFGMLYYTDSYDWKNHRTVQDTYLDKQWRQESWTQVDGRSRRLTGQLGANYVINDSHSLGASYRITHTPYSESQTSVYTEVAQDGKAYETSDNVLSGEDGSTGHQLDFYYNGKIGMWSMDFDGNAMWRNSDTDNRSLENNTAADAAVSERTITTRNETDYKLYAAKLTFSRPLGGGNLAFGAEYSFMNRNMDYRNVEGILANTLDEIREDNVSAFAEYSRQFGKVGAQIGLRYEYVDFDYSLNLQPMPEQCKEYHNVFPSASVEFPVGNTRLALQYRAEIQRPYYSQLSSNIAYINRYTYEGGNPFLLPTVTQSVNLSASYRWLMGQLGYQHIKDGIFNVSRTYSDAAPAIALISMENVSPYDILFAAVTASPTIGWWSPVLTASVSKQWLDTAAPEGRVSLEKPMYTLNWNNSFKLPAGFLLSAGVNWMSSGETQNMRLLDSMWGMNASLYKEMLKGRLTFLLQANDIFNTQKENLMLYAGAVRTMQMFNEANVRNVSLTLRYKFNATKSKYKGTGAGQEQRSRM